MRTAAVFDLDGTLLLGMSAERVFLRYLLGHRQLGVQALLGWIRGLGAGLKGNKGYLAGLDTEAVFAMARHCFTTRLAPCISALATSIIEQHKTQSHITGILSGSLDFMVELFREHLDLDFGCGTRLEIEESRYTGRIAGLRPYAQGKVPALSALLQAHGIDPAHSYAYADAFADRFFLELFAHPVAFNPDRRLLQHARSRGWLVQWDERLLTPGCAERWSASPRRAR